LPYHLIKFVDHSFIGVGMGDVLLRLIVFADLGFFGSWIGKLEAAVLAADYLESFLAISIILALDVFVKFVFFANWTTVQIFHSVN